MDTDLCGVQRVRALASVGLFLAAIVLPTLDTLVGIAPEARVIEKRALSALPSAPTNREQLRAFPTAFQAWFDDHFGLRANLIRAHNRLKAEVLGQAPSDNLVIGADRRLFYAGQGALDLYRAFDPFETDELAAWLAYFEQQRDWLADRGVRFLIVIAPDKSSIHPEELPRTVRRIGSTTRQDQLLAYVRERSDLEVLDLRPTLCAAKDGGSVYLESDTHWNDRGALVVERAIVERLAAWFPALEPCEDDDFSRERVRTRGGDLAALMALEDVFTENEERWTPKAPFPCRLVAEGLVPPAGRAPSGLQGDVPVLERTTPYALVQDAPHLPSLVIFRDSFGTRLLQFLPWHFAKSVCYWQYFFDPRVVEREEPDVVVYQFVERVLMRGSPIANAPEVAIDFEARRAFRVAPEPVVVYAESELTGGIDIALPKTVARRELVVRLEFEVDSATTLRLFASSAPDALPVLEREVEAGRRIVYATIRRAGQDARIRLLESGGGGLRARALEVRAYP